MSTYISMLNWTGKPQPHADDVRDAIERHAPSLRRRGLHSIVFLPDEGECAAVMIAACAGRQDAYILAASILPSAEVHVESMLFDDGQTAPVPARGVVPPPRRDYHRMLIRAITHG